MELFNTNKNQDHPLAFNMSPKTLEEFVGQDHILGKNKPLKNLILEDKLISIILWGPPGTGKTALSKLIANKSASYYIALNAVTDKVNEIKKAVAMAKMNLTKNQKTILFIDEIHRFSKIQQDALLPNIENGLLTLIGATTENPFYSVTPALRSRVQIY